MEIECIPAPESCFRGRNGWIRKSFQRQSGETKDRIDKYWYTPVLRKKLRSIFEVKRFLDALDTFEANGNEQIAYDLSKTRRRTNNKVNDTGNKRKAGTSNTCTNDDDDDNDQGYNNNTPSIKNRKRLATKHKTSTVMMEGKPPPPLQFATTAVNQNYVPNNNNNNQQVHYSSTIQKLQSPYNHPMYIQMNQYHFHGYYNPRQSPYYNYNDGPPLVVQPVGDGNDTRSSKNNVSSSCAIYQSDSFCQFSQMIQRRGF